MNLAATTWTGLIGVGGFLIGWVYFATLRHCVVLWVSGQHPLRAAALTLMRLAGTALALALTARLGALALLAALTGLLLARQGALRRTQAMK